MRTFLTATRLGVLVLLIAASCSSSHSATRATSTSTTATPGTSARGSTTTAKPRDPRSDAVSLAHRMLGQAALPPGARRSDVALPALIQGPFETPSGTDLVHTNAEWSVPAGPDAVVSFVKAHVPAGYIQEGVGTSGSPTERSTSAVDVLLPNPVNVSDAQLQIRVEAVGVNAALVNVVALVQWTPLRPVDEHVPARDDVVVVSVIRIYAAGKPTVRRVVVTDSAEVARFVSAFDALRVAPPGTVSHCFLLTNKSVAYQVAFAASSSAKPDVTASIAACSPIKVTVNGRASADLDELATSAFTLAVERALGVSELRFQ